MFLDGLPTHRIGVTILPLEYTQFLRDFDTLPVLVLPSDISVPSSLSIWLISTCGVLFCAFTAIRNAVDITIFSGSLDDHFLASANPCRSRESST
jgi:hypothetical protein